MWRESVSPVYAGFFFTTDIRRGENKGILCTNFKFQNISNSKSLEEFFLSLHTQNVRLVSTKWGGWGGGDYAIFDSAQKVFFFYGFPEIIMCVIRMFLGSPFSLVKLGKKKNFPKPQPDTASLPITPDPV